MRMVLFDYSFSIEKVNLPEPEGDPMTVQEKVYMPCKEHPDVSLLHFLSQGAIYEFLCCWLVFWLFASGGFEQ